MARIRFRLLEFHPENGTALVEFRHPTGDPGRATTTNVRLRKTAAGNYATGATQMNAIAAQAPIQKWRDHEAADRAGNGSAIRSLIGLDQEIIIPDDPADPVIV